MRVRSEFNDTVHSPVRLRICALLLRVDEIEFSAIRDVLELSDANLSKNLKVLTGAGIATIRKAASPGRPDARRRTWVSLTLSGRRAVEGHLRALTEIASGGA